MKTIIFLSILVMFFSPVWTQNKEREKIDVKQYIIRSDFKKFEKHEIASHTSIIFVTKCGQSNEISLDLEAFTVDSVVFEKKRKLDFVKFQKKLKINFQNNLLQDSSYQLDIFYHGIPAKDPRWGGFYFAENYAFNMGVGMNSSPQVYGRCWFPCNDTLTDKALYRFVIKCDKQFSAVCSGVLDSVSTQNDQKTYFWSQKIPVSTYLVSVAVGNYVLSAAEYCGIEKKIPIEYYTKPNQTEKMQKSLKHINQALECFEKCFGPYPFNKVGYVNVPFYSGAMEHAENIAYPNYAVTGNLSNETLWVHELSHSWFGNCVTCSTPEDMWINEGWASYAEALFTEFVYGKQAYKKYVRKNLKSVLLTAHLSDDGYKSVYGNNGAYTYGSTVYDKGSDLIHTLRQYLGDSLFFLSTKKFLQKFRFSDADSYELIDVFSETSQKNLTHFFKNRLFTEGFSHYEITEFLSKKYTDGFHTKLTIHQRLLGRNVYEDSTKIELTAFDKQLNSKTVEVYVSGEFSVASIITDFKPVSIILDPDEKVSDASVDELQFVEKQGIYNFNESDFRLDVKSLKNKAPVQCRLNCLQPENVENVVSSRNSSIYWTINGYANSLAADGHFIVFKNLQGFEKTTKEFQLFFRKTINSQWKSIPFVYKEIDSETFELEVTNMKFGDYYIIAK